MFVLSRSPDLATFSVLVLIVLLTVLPTVHHTRYGGYFKEKVESRGQKAEKG
jgi:hypothetical protein